MAQVNVRFAGKVVAVGSIYCMVETRAVARDERIFTEQHKVKHAGSVKPAVGDWLEVAGHLESVDGKNWIEPSVSINILTDEPEDQAMYAWIEGEAAQSFFEPVDVKNPLKKAVPFGVASVKIDGKRRQRGLVFNTLIAHMRQNLKAGAIVKLAGRLQYRSYEKDGEQIEVAEIICNNEHSKVIKLSEKKNPFSFGNEPATSAQKPAVAGMENFGVASEECPF